MSTGAEGECTKEAVLVWNGLVASVPERRSTESGEGEAACSRGSSVGSDHDGDGRSPGPRAADRAPVRQAGDAGA